MTGSVAGEPLFLTDESLAIVSRPQRTACWLIAVLVSGAAGGLVASIAPPRLRLIGLFAVALGAVLGWLAGRLALKLRMSSRRVATAGGLLTSVTGCVVVTLLHWQSYARELQVADKPNAGQAMIANMLKAAQENAPTDPEAQAAMLEFQGTAEKALDEARQRRTFRGYLAHRVASLGLTGVMPTALWGIEVLLAGVAGAVVIRQVAARPFCPYCDDFLAVSRTHRFQFPLPEALVELISEAADPTEDQLTVQLLSCSCQETAAQMDFAVDHGAVGGRTVGCREITRDEYMKLSRLMDSTDGIAVKS